MCTDKDSEGNRTDTDGDPDDGSSQAYCYPCCMKARGIVAKRAFRAFQYISKKYKYKLNHLPMCYQIVEWTTF